MKRRQPNEIPTGIAPLSSIIGNAAVSITVNSTDKELNILLKNDPISCSPYV